MRCEHPINIGGKKLVPCGKCLACRSSNTNEWIARFMCESDAFKRGAFFGTLTYNNEALPKGGNLDEKAVALFWKRVKKELNLYSNGLVYTYCGEYGTKRGRPHYHFICAGMCTVEGDVVMTEHVREVLERQWKKHNKGSFVYLSEIRTPEASIRYLINYTNKTKGKYAIHPGESKADFTKRTGLVAPFVRFSQGISKKYYEKNKDKLATAEYLQIGKHKFCIPRYFRKQLERDRTVEQHAETLQKSVDYCVSEIKKKYKSKGLLSDFGACDVLMRMGVFPIHELSEVLSNFRKYQYDRQRIKSKFSVRFKRNRIDFERGIFGDLAEVRFQVNFDELEAECRRELDELFLEYYSSVEEYKSVLGLVNRWNELMESYRFLMKDTIVQAGINQKFKILAKTEKMYYAKNTFLD